MRFPTRQRYYSGISVPLFSLRSTESAGCGDFLDLQAFGAFAKACGFDLIQLLPVNDTGTSSSPYSSLSSIALNPVYLRIDDIPFSGDASEMLRSLKAECELPGKGRYGEVYERKLSILKSVYKKNLKAIRGDAALDAWIEANPWVKPYAVYALLKERNARASWADWEAYRNPEPGLVEGLWNELLQEVRFYAWVQLLCEEQFGKAAEKLKELGILLKGDIPILMCEDSADVWASRELFRLDRKAGAPPDQYSALGQNWGFPVYDWDGHGEGVRSFWKERIQKASRFYDAFRLDHVLGFFRIWTIDCRNITGSLGIFDPSVGITRQQLIEAGFDEGRIAWLSQPHISLHAVQGCPADPPDEIIREGLSRIGNEDLFKFSASIKGELDIDELPLSDETRETMLAWYRDRSLYEAKPDLFYPSFTYRETKAYLSLNERERESFEALAAEAYAASEAIWEKRGKAILRELQGASDMLVCAEDLGAVPDCVPRTLSELGILGLKVNRWTKEWKKPGEPYIPAASYPYGTVATPSVHDTSTLASYWDEEADQSERKAFLASIGITDLPCDRNFTDETASAVIRGILSTSSMICILQVQDIAGLSKDEELYRFSRERVNVPGTVNDENWTMRLPIQIHELQAKKELIRTVRSLTDTRRNRT